MTDQTAAAAAAPSPIGEVVDMSGASVEAAPAEVWPLKIKLRKPIRGNKGEEVTELVFREPTGRDIITAGNPVKINQFGEFIIHEGKMNRMIAQLSGVLAPLLEPMHPKDWNNCAYSLAGFFLPDGAFL
jgi:hypothetical protein